MCVLACGGQRRRVHERLTLVGRAQMTDHGIVTSTEQTIGFPTGETTTAYPFGTGVEYQNGEEMYAGLAGKRPLHPATLKFMQARDEAAANGWPARYQSLADSSGLDEMDSALQQAKGKDSISGKEDLLTKKLDAAFDAINGKSPKLSRKPEQKSYSDMDEQLEDMRLSDDLLNAAGSASKRGRRGRGVARGGCLGVSRGCLGLLEVARSCLAFF